MSEDFKFRLRFHLQEGHVIDIDRERVELLKRDGGPTIVLRGDKETIKTSSYLIVVGEPYASSDEAMKDALMLRERLLAMAARKRIGINLGEDVLRAGFTKKALDYYREELGKPARNDVHGIDVWAASGKTAFIRMDVSSSLTIGGDQFLSLMKEILAAPSPLSGNEGLSAELFALSHFDSSPRSRFLTLMTAIEALLTAAPRPDEAQAFVEETVARVKDLACDSATKEALRSSLQWLKSESIGQTGRKLAEELLGEQTYLDRVAKKFFAYIYGVRSEIMHSGRPADSAEDMLLLANTTATFVGDLLWELMDRRAGQLTTAERPTVIDAIQISGTMSPSGPVGPIVPAPYRFPFRPEE